MLEKGMIPVPGKTEGDGARIHHATRNRAQFKTSELFISGIFLLIFLDHRGLQLTEIMGDGTADERGIP